MPQPKLPDQVREQIRQKHLSRRTEQAYVGWVRRFVHFHEVRGPSELGAEDGQRFLSHLAVEEQVAASTQHQAFAALLFLYRRVLKQDLGPTGDTVRAKRPVRLPVVFSKPEVRAVLAELTGMPALVAGPVVWLRVAAHGMSSPARQGCRFRAGPVPGPRRLSHRDVRTT